MTTQIITVRDVARELGKSESSIKGVAIEHRIGKLVHPRLRCFTAADVHLLRSIFSRRQPGRPPKTR